MIEESGASQQAHDDVANIRDFSVRKWRTLNSVARENFRREFREETNAELFSEAFIHSVGARWRELQRVHLRLAVVLFLLVLFIGAIQFGAVQTITIFGLRVTNSNPSIAVLVLIATMLLFSTSILSMVADHYESVIQSFAIEKVGDDLAKLYVLQFTWQGTTPLDASWRRDGDQFGSKIIFFFILLLVTSLVLFAFLAEALQLYLLTSAILFLYDHPRLPLPMNIFTVVLSASAIVFCVIKWILQLPLPYTDYSNLSRLKELEEKDPTRATEIRTTIARNGLRRERRNNLLLEQLTLVVAMGTLYLVFYREAFFSDLFMLWPLIVGAVVLSFFISPTMDRIESAVILGSRRSDQKQLQVERYVRNKKRLFYLRIFVSLVSGVLFFFWFAGVQEMPDLFSFSGS